MGGTSKIIRNGVAPNSAFGDQRVVEPRPVIQMLPQYEIIGDEIETFSAAGGTITSSNNQYCVFSGTSLGGYGVLRSKRPIVYKTGVGIVARFTARFGTEKAALSTTRAGLFQATDALQFGYDGTEFGILYEHHGVLEIQELQITAAASGTESLTVTINGTGHTFDVSGTTIADNAKEVADELEANIAGWRFQAIGDTVIGYYQTTADATGSFSLVNNTGGGTCAGTFTEIIAGAPKTTEWIPQTEWNLDRASWLNPINGNVYQITMQYLGFGGITFWIEEPKTGSFIPVHRIQYAGTTTTPSLANPSMRLGIVAASLGSTGTSVHCHTASMVAMTDGPAVIPRPGRAYSATRNAVTTTSTNIITLKGRFVYNRKIVVGEILPGLITATTDSGKGAIVDIYVDPVLNDIPNFFYVDETNSITAIDTSAGTYSSGGRLIASFSVSGNGDGSYDLSSLGQYLLPGERLAICARVISGAASAVSVSVNWQEDF